MTSAAWVLIAVAAAVAVVDWCAVVAGRQTVRYVAKPLTMVVIIAAALALHPVDGTMRAWFVVGLVFGLIGDVFLMLPDEKWFVFGLGSFLICHLCYIPGFVAGGVDRSWAIVGAIAIALAVSVVGPKVLAGARSRDATLTVPVAIYMAVISAMVAFAIGSTVPVAIAGAVLFYLSDLMIGWSSFVSDVRGSDLFVITTYHLAQALLVISLAIAR